MGVETVELVGEEAGMPAIVVFARTTGGSTPAVPNGASPNGAYPHAARPPVPGRVVVADGRLGAAALAALSTTVRAGRYFGVEPQAPLIVVLPEAQEPSVEFNETLRALAQADGQNPSAEPNGVPNGLPNGLLGVIRVGDAPAAAYEVHQILLRLQRPPETPSVEPPPTETPSTEVSRQMPRQTPPEAVPQKAAPQNLVSGTPPPGNYSAARDFDVATGHQVKSGHGHIHSPEEREAILEAREAARNAARNNERKGIFKHLPLIGKRKKGTSAGPAAEEITSAPVDPVVHPPLDPEVTRGLYYSPFPSVFLWVNNKGGVGKTSLTIGTAAAFAQMGRSPAGTEALRVLVVEQNFLNPDIESRMQLKPGTIRGLGAYVEDLLSAWETGHFVPETEVFDGTPDGTPDARPFDITPYTSHSYVPNLDVLLIGNRENERQIAADYLPEAGFEAVFRELYRSLGAAYDVICIDLANSRPESDRDEEVKSVSARLISFWASAADTIYVPLDASGTSFEQARRVVAEARTLCVDDEQPPGVPPPAGVVPILNAFPEHRKGDDTWMDDDEAEIRLLEEEYLPAVGADYPRLPGVTPGAVNLKVPNYKEVTYWNNAGLISCLESNRFARAYTPIVMDAAIRAYENQAIRAGALG